MIINCDVDGVINNLMEVVIDIFNTEYNKNFTIEDVTKYNITSCFNKDDANRIQNIFKDPEIWNIVRPIKNSQKIIKTLIQNGYDVYLVTNNNPHSFGEKYDWIKYYFPFVDDSKIICAANKWMIKCDVMIEDCYDNLTAKCNYERILFNRPWNQSNKDFVYEIYRCENWNDVYSTLMTLDKKNNNME